MERKTRFELATFSLARRCSTAELLPLKYDYGWGRRDSNSHALRHMILSHARLPVPTLPRLAFPHRVDTTKGVTRSSIAASSQGRAYAFSVLNSREYERAPLW